MATVASILDMEPSALVKVERFILEPLEDRTGRVSVFEHPIPGHVYVVGADFAYGIPGKDYDAAVILDSDTDPPRQVGTLYGHWGERFDRVLYAALRFWNDAFLLGERQVGLPIIRTLVEQYGHGWVWMERDLKRPGRKPTGMYGYPATVKRARDPLLRAARIAVRDKRIVLRDATLIDQLGKLQFVGPDSKEPEEIEDADLDIRLVGGGSPDLVKALCYALHALDECPKYDRPRAKYDRGTLGAVLEHEALENEDVFYIDDVEVGGRTAHRSIRAQRRRGPR